MVKNLTGGTKKKGLARKHQRSSGDGKLRLPEDVLEQVACVTKMLGNGMCEIHTEKERLIGHIRNKFRGRQKRQNMISTSTIVLIGLREWENPIKNCDILTIYSDSQVNQLKDNPKIDMVNVLKLRYELSHVETKNISHDDFEFTNQDEEEEEEVPQNTMKHGETFTLENIGEVDIDDI